jgi:dTDP-4-dehydrorhamnose 3,5-epimerase
MRFGATPIPGAWVIDVDPASDERGSFARTFDAREFAARGLRPVVAQCSTSFNHRAGTLRGLHYQAAPHGECKLVRCTAGAVFDVLVDLRRDSPAHARWHAVELSSENRRAVYVPRGVAHGFQTLVDACEVLYTIDVPYVPEAARGVRWDDPAFGIDWPEPPGERIVSARDRGFPDYVNDARGGATS